MSFDHLIIQLLNGLYWRSTRKPRGRDLVLGMTRTQDRRDLVILPETARPMHLGIMGLSGVGKTYFLENLIRQDIEHQTGFAVFDVHGDLAESIVAFLAAHVSGDTELGNRVVIVDPSDPNCSIGFNPLEQTSDTSAFLQAQELAHILRTRWETRSFGARTEELLRNTLYTLSAHHLTLLELPHLLANRDFRTTLVDTLDERGVKDYWKGRYEPLSEAMKAVVREPLLTRISAFLADPQIREVVGQRRSTFTFRDAIAKGLWVVINLSKGKLGENSSVLGSLLFTKLELDVMAQARIPKEQRKFFAVYADELQNLAGRNFATLIAEARKYRIGVTAGHQFWHQLSPEMRTAMLGVGSRVFFRLHYHDARELAGELDPTEKQWYTEVLTRLPQGQAVFRTGADQPVPFTVQPHEKPKTTTTDVERLREHSRSLYATPRTRIRQDINHRYQQQPRAVMTQRLNRSQSPNSKSPYDQNTHQENPPSPPTPASRY